MFFRIIFCLGVAVLTSCSTAKMAMHPGLEVDSEKYKITERPIAFSGGDLVFGPYKATKISRGFINSSGSFISFGKNRVGKKKKARTIPINLRVKVLGMGIVKQKREIRNLA